MMISLKHLLTEATYKICGSKKVKDLSQGFEGKKAKHLFCPDCKSHQYNGKWYTKKEWEKWINS